jgi:hypothetical protein
MPPGKNFSRNRPRSGRSPSDFYQTPYCLSQTFIDAHIIPFWDHSLIADFCSGQGALVHVLVGNGCEVVASDINDTLSIDFFMIHETKPYGIMNPPFNLFNRWVEHCFDVFTKSFALLAPTTYLQGVARFNADKTGIFQNEMYPCTHIYTFNRYPMLSVDLRPDGLIETGMQALSWFVWTKPAFINDKHYNGGTVHRWLDIDQYVCRKSSYR